jgi:peroxiredoxin
MKGKFIIFFVIFSVIAILIGIVFTFIPSDVFAQNNRTGSDNITGTKTISDEIIRALRDAGISTRAEGIEPVDFTLPLLDGTNFTLSQQKGKVVFLNFWATWCPPCRNEMPSMEALHQRFKDRGLDIIAVNLRESKNDVEAFMNQNNLTFSAILDSRGAIGSGYNVHAIPATYIIDKRGLIVGQLVGSIDWNTPKIITAFEALLAE